MFIVISVSPLPVHWRIAGALPRCLPMKILVRRPRRL
jgi:hypothetical protein